MGRTRRADRRRELSRRASWVFADQALSSATNAGLAIAIATRVSDEEFGAFALAFSLYGFLVALALAASGRVLSVRFAGADREQYGVAVRGATGASVLGASLVAVGLAASALLLEGSLRDVLLCLAVTLPGLLLQDTWRHVFIAVGSPRKAFLNDAVWLVLQVVFIAVLMLNDVVSAAPYVLAWGLAAVIAAGFGVLQAKQRPSLALGRRWIPRHRDLIVPGAAEVGATMGALQVTLFFIGTSGGLAIVGAVRAAQTLLGPMNVIGFSATAFTIPEVSRRRLSRRALLWVAGALSLLLTAANFVWGGTFLLLPSELGERLLGESWAGARSVLPWMIAYTCLITATSGATAMLRAWDYPSYVFATSAILGPTILVCAIVGSELSGAVGTAQGFALAAAIVAPLPWAFLLTASRRGQRVHT